MNSFKKVKNNVVKFHRFSGTIMAFMMLVWFLSGFVLLFYEFPEWENKNQLQYLKNISSDEISFPDSVIAKKTEIYKLNNDLVYKFDDVVCDQSFQPIKKLSIQNAVKFVSEKFDISFKNYETESISEPDIWLKSNSIKCCSEIIKINFDDKNKSQVYLNLNTAEIIQFTTEEERFFAWIGAIPHLIYFKDFSGSNFFWKWIIFFLSGFGSLMAFAGLMSGLIKSVRKKKKKLTPYGSRLYKLHHYLGFVFGLVTFTWVFSGLMSLQPLELFLDKTEEILLKEKWNSNFTNAVIEKTDFQNLNFNNVKKISITNFSDEQINILKFSEFEEVRLLSGEFHNRNSEILIEQIVKHIQFVYDLPVEQIKVLNSFDNYYFEKKRKKNLPVIKVEFKNNIKSIFYFDPLNYEIVKTTNKISRLNRWVYKALHRFDFLNLNLRKPLMLFLLAGGTLLSITGTLFYFRKKIKRNKITKR